MAIDSGKILKISEEEWLKVNGKRPEDYTRAGVHYCGYLGDITGGDFMHNFSFKVPNNAEVVVGHTVEFVVPRKTFGDPSREYVYTYGTALIPKSNSEKSGTDTGRGY